MGHEAAINWIGHNTLQFENDLHAHVLHFIFAATIANDYEHKPQKKVIFLFDVTCELFMLKSIVTQE